MTEAETIRAILTTFRRWAVVGWSEGPGRDSHRIAALLDREGYEVTRINPVAGAPAVASLAEAATAGPLEVVDLFRRSDQAGVHVDEAISLGAKAVWMQLGVIDEAAAQRARAAGLLVVMDRCPAIELPRLGL